MDKNNTVLRVILLTSLFQDKQSFSSYSMINIFLIVLGNNDDVMLPHKWTRHRFSGGSFGIWVVFQTNKGFFGSLNFKKNREEHSHFCLMKNISIISEVLWKLQKQGLGPVCSLWDADCITCFILSSITSSNNSVWTVGYYLFHLQKLLSFLFIQFYQRLHH